MKRIVFVLAVLNCLFITLKAQTYTGYRVEMFLFSQPDARSEAMGRGSAVLYGSPFTNFYNPASSSFSRGINTEVSHLEFAFPNGRRSNYDVYGAGVNLGKYGSIAFNYMHHAFGEEYYFMDKSSLNILMFNYSHNIINGLSAGVNINCFQDKIGNEDINLWTCDFGLLKKYSLETEKISHDLYLGLSITNITNTNILISGVPYECFPSIMRIAAGYELKTQGKVADLQLFKALLTAQYMDLINTSEYSQFQLGTEITLLEMFKIRGGYFTQELKNYGIASNKLRLNEATYGFGIELPVKKISGLSLPLNIRFDHTSLPFPTYNTNIPGGKKCPIYSLSMSYDF